MQAIEQALTASITVKNQLLKDKTALHVLELLANRVVAAFRADKKVLLCGNGGSAGDAQHLAAELSGRLYYDRPPLFAEALHVNSSFLTAVANDYSYEEIYARAVRAMGRPGDVLIGISTSGNSPNVLRAFATAREQGMLAAGLTGETGGKMKDVCDLLICVPSRDTARIQECHITLGHILCEIVERTMFPPRPA